MNCMHIVQSLQASSSAQVEFSKQIVANPRQWLGHFGEFESIEFGHKIYFLTEAIVI